MLRSQSEDGQLLLPAVSEASEFVGEKTREGSSGPQAEERARRKVAETAGRHHSVPCNR